MSDLIVLSTGPLQGSSGVPGDKSISHRALLLGALASGTSQVSGLLASGDTLATLACVRALGIEVEEPPGSAALVIHGRGLQGWQAPAAILDCARSGTTMRLLAGILAGQPFDSTLSGEEQLRCRPMSRVVEPLRRMGADIVDCAGYAPLLIHGKQLHGREHTLQVASAQVKSALLLAGLYAVGPTTVAMPGPARDHTERMLAAMGVAVEVSGFCVGLRPAAALAPLTLQVPGDISSAAFPLVAATLVPGSRVTLNAVGVNPTRTGLLDVLAAMGANIVVTNQRGEGGEPVADLAVQSALLRGTEIGGELVVRMIDEFPVLAVAATQATGSTLVRDAAELRVKESDRIAAVVAELQKMGAAIAARPDGFVVEGPARLHGARVDSHGDHRLAMALAVAGLVAEGKTVIRGAERIADSFPGFVEQMQRLNWHCEYSG
jgi:3-phosphoshikimate 1-carboxyvinyltransferase